MVEYILCKYCDFSNKYGNCTIRITEPRTNCEYFSIDDCSADDLINHFKKVFKNPNLNSSLLTYLLNKVNEAVDFEEEDVEVKLVDISDFDKFQKIHEQVEKSRKNNEYPKQCKCNIDVDILDKINEEDIEELNDFDILEDEELEEELKDHSWIICELNHLSSEEIANILLNLPLIKYSEVTKIMRDKTNPYFR